MAVTHDWNCLAHGTFEARGSPQKPPKCPHGCSGRFVQLVHLQPPSHISRRTKVGDQAVRALAADFGMSDVRNDKDGGSVMDAMRRGQQMRPTFMSIPHAPPGFSRDPNYKPASFDPGAAIGAQVPGENAMMRLPAPKPKVDKGYSYRPSELPDAV